MERMNEPQFLGVSCGEGLNRNCMAHSDKLNLSFLRNCLQKGGHNEEKTTWNRVVLQGQEQWSVTAHP